MKCRALTSSKSVSSFRAACRVLELERLRIADLKNNQEIHERLEAETEMSWALREALAEHKISTQQHLPLHVYAV